MKIVFIRQSYSAFGGAERIVASLVRNFSSPQYVAENISLSVIARVWNADVPLLRCHPFYIGRIWRDWGFARSVQTLLRKHSFDIVQSHERIPGADIFYACDGLHASYLALCEQAAKRETGSRFAALKIKLARWDPWHRYTLEMERQVLSHPSLKAVVCISDMVRNDISRRFPQLARKLHLIRSSIDLQRFHPRVRAEYRVSIRAQLGWSDTVPVIVFVGSGFERKGVFRLIHAMAQMQNNTAHLIVVGKDKKQYRAQALAEKLKLTKRVSFVGPQNDVRPYLGAADLFCLPTLYDPLAIAVLEAMACGLPVITTRTCGAGELLTSTAADDLSIGAVYDVFDNAALSQELDKLCNTLQDRTRQKLMGERARLAVLNFDDATITKEVLALYRGVVSTQSPSLT